MSQKLSALPVGAKIKDANTKYNGATITWLVGGHNHYGANQTALVSEKIISLKAVDAKEASNSDSNRKNYGNNRYSQSNIRQWLNSSATSWYSAQHSADAPPNNANVYSNYNEYDAEAGFLTNFSENMRNALASTTLTVAKNTVTDGGGSETVSDKVFLLSNTEVGLANENGVAEGKLMPLFSTAANRIAQPTAAAVTKSEYTNTSLAASKPWYYWLRTPNASISYNARYVYTDGSLSNYSAYHGNNGVRPALNLNSEILVSDSTDSDGAYTIVWNAAPIITNSTASGTTLYEGDNFVLDGTAKDTDAGDIVSVKYSVNGGTSRAIASGISDGVSAIAYNRVLTFKSSKIYDGTTAVSAELTSGVAHSVKVWAEDDKGNVSNEIVRTFYVVTNRAPVLNVDVPSTAGSIDSDSVKVTGSINDPDGNDMVLTYRINSGTAIEIYRGGNNSFEFDVAFGDLVVGMNTVVVEVADTYGFKASKTIKLNKAAIKTEQLVGDARYKVMPPKGSAKGIVLWVQRDPKLVVEAFVSAVQEGEAERFVSAPKTNTAFVNDELIEDEFIYEAGEAKSAISFKLAFTRPSLDVTDAITLITGVLD